MPETPDLTLPNGNVYYAGTSPMYEALPGFPAEVQPDRASKLAGSVGGVDALPDEHRRLDVVEELRCLALSSSENKDHRKAIACLERSVQQQADAQVRQSLSELLARLQSSL